MSSHINASLLWLEARHWLNLVPFKGQPILDMGVGGGGGRTVSHLLEVSKDYTGIDYVNEMVERSRIRFPGVPFQQADARDLSAFANESFYLIMFSSNGVDMMDHKGRMPILREVRRLLTPGGVFVFSTYNHDNNDYKKLFQFPGFTLSLNPIKNIRRGVRFLLNLKTSIINRFRYLKLELHLPQYSIVNDKCHNYANDVVLHHSN